MAGRERRHNHPSLNRKDRDETTRRDGDLAFSARFGVLPCESGKSRRRLGCFLRQGDVVWIPPGLKNWHGAAATTGMTHIAIQEHLDGQVVEWMEQVSDEQYRR
jgi:hypothetical protein